MTLQALIFDVDGTLAETEEIHRQAFNEAFARHGEDWVWDRALYAELLDVVGGPARMRAYVEAHRPRDLARLEHAGAFAAIHKTKSEIYLSLIEEGAPLRPGVARLLGDARSAGLKIGVSTSSSRANFEALILNAMGFEALDWFGAVVTGDDVERSKPSADPYALALSRLGVTADAAIAIEDSGRGLKAARAADVDVIAAPGLYTRGHDLSDALLVVSDLGEPHEPFEVISGDPGPFGHVSVDALRFWHARARGGEGAAA